MILRKKFYDESAEGGTTGTPDASAPTEAPPADLATQLLAATGGDDTPEGGDPPTDVGPTNVSTDDNDTPQPSGTAASMFETLREKHNLDLTGKYETEEELIAGLANAVAMVGRRDEDAEEWRAKQAQYREWEQQQWEIEQQDNPQVPANNPQEPEHWWNPPSRPNGWEKFRVQDPATGQYDWSPSTPPQIRNAVEDYTDYVNNWTTQLSENPQQAMQPMLAHVHESAVQEAMRRMGIQQQQMHAQTESQGIIESHEEWLFEHTSDGGRIFDGNGKAMWTPEGQFYRKTVEQLYKDGLQDHQRVDEIALAMTQREFAAPRQPDPPPAATHTPVPATQRTQPAGNSKPPKRKGSLADMLLEDVNALEK